MANYKIVNVAANKCLNIYGDNVTSLKNNQNVTLWADSGAPEQTWVIDSLGNGVVVKSSVDNRFGLNAYRSSASKYNCDVYPWSGNETDAKVNFVATSGGYRIKLANYDMYLDCQRHWQRGRCVLGPYRRDDHPNVELRSRYRAQEALLFQRLRQRHEPSRH